MILLNPKYLSSLLLCVSYYIIITGKRYNNIIGSYNLTSIILSVLLKRPSINASGMAEFMILTLST